MVVPWRGTGLVAIALLLAACGGGGDQSTSVLTTPKPAAYPTRRGPSSYPSSTPFGSPPVSAATALRETARTYYDGAGPAPQDDDRFRPACLLMLPTTLPAVTLKAVPTAGFNIFDEFEVTWTLTAGRGKGLTLFVYPPGDPSDRDFFGPQVQVTTLPDGTEFRAVQPRPTATLIRVPTQNCEYAMEASGSFSSSELATAVRSLRLVFAP
jgi:hypothetical protein